MKNETNTITWLKNKVSIVIVEEELGENDILKTTQNVFQTKYIPYYPSKPLVKTHDFLKYDAYTIQCTSTYKKYINFIYASKYTTTTCTHGRDDRDRWIERRVGVAVVEFHRHQVGVIGLRYHGNVFASSLLADEMFGHLPRRRLLYASRQWRTDGQVRVGGDDIRRNRRRRRRWQWRQWRQWRWRRRRLWRRWRRRQQHERPKRRWRRRQRRRHRRRVATTAAVVVVPMPLLLFDLPHRKLPAKVVADRRRLTAIPVLRVHRIVRTGAFRSLLEKITQLVNNTRWWCFNVTPQ